MMLRQWTSVWEFGASSFQMGNSNLSRTASPASSAGLVAHMVCLYSECKAAVCGGDWILGPGLHSLKAVVAWLIPQLCPFSAMVHLICFPSGEGSKGIRSLSATGVSSEMLQEERHLLPNPAVRPFFPSFSFSSCLLYLNSFPPRQATSPS